MYSSHMEMEGVLLPVTAYTRSGVSAGQDFSGGAAAGYYQRRPGIDYYSRSLVRAVDIIDRALWKDSSCYGPLSS